MPTDQTSLVDTFRDSDLPPDATIALLMGDPHRVVLVADEIQRIQRGDIAPLQVDIDQVTAFVLLSYLQLALKVAGPNQSNPIVEKFVRGLEEAVGRTCPEIAGVWQVAKKARGGGKPEPAGADGPPLALPAPSRSVAERIVFETHGPATWEEWDAKFHHQLSWQHLVRRVKSILGEQP